MPSLRYVVDLVLVSLVVLIPLVTHKCRWFLVGVVGFSKPKKLVLVP